MQILAKDVSIVSSQPAFQTSVLNLLEATVVEIGEVNTEHPFVDIKLDIGCPLLATITRNHWPRSNSIQDNTSMPKSKP